MYHKKNDDKECESLKKIYNFGLMKENNKYGPKWAS